MTGSELSAEQVVKNLLVGVVPEREAEIEQLWARYNPKIIVAESRRGITLNATKDRILFDQKTMDVFWLVGFSGWQAIECYSPHVITSALCSEPLQTLLDSDSDLPRIELSYKERLKAVRSLIENSDTDTILWPPDIPLPSADRNLRQDPQYSATFDLSLIAAAFTVLHEFRHVMLAVDGQRPADMKEEELQADVWGREFMTAKVAAYAEANGNEYHQVLRKRSMGLAIAALILHEITPIHGGNCNYFSIKTRLSALLDNTPLPENDHFWVFAASLLMGVCRQRHISLPMQPMPARKLTGAILDSLPE